MADFESGYDDEESQDAIGTILDTLFNYDDTTPQIELPYLQNFIHAGRLWGGEITDNGDGTVDVGDGAGLIKSDEASIGTSPTAINEGQGSTVEFVSWSTTTITLVSDAYNYIYYDGSTGSVDVTTTFSDISDTRDFTLGRVYLQGTSEAHIRLCGTNLWDYGRRVQLFGEERFPVERADGLQVGNPSGLYISHTAGVLWAELINRFTVTSFDSSGTDTFNYWYRDGAGGWTRTTGNTEVDNLNYDDGTGTLAELGNNDFGVHWIYVTHEGEVHLIYGRSSYNTLSVATEATPPPDIPPLVGSYGTLLGRAIVEKSASTLSQLDSAFVEQFTTTAVTDHGNLAGLSDDDHTQYNLENQRNVVTVTANYTASNDDFVLSDASGGAITVTLPPPSANYRVDVKKIDSSSNDITIATDDTGTIDGASSKTISTQYESITMVSDGTNWFII